MLINGNKHFLDLFLEKEFYCHHDSEIYEWAEEHKFDKGSYGWRRFYEVPTLGFKSFDGFQYLGEIEKSYDETKRRIGEKPSSNLIRAMAEKIGKL